MQGQLEITTLKGTGAAAAASEDLVERKPFFMLTLELPQARLFQDAVDKDIIPQVRPSPSAPVVSVACGHARSCLVHACFLLYSTASVLAMAMRQRGYTAVRRVWF